MNPTGDGPEKRADNAAAADAPEAAPISKFVMLGAQVGGLNLFIVLIAVFGGIWLDRLLGTKPVIMLILVLGSAPIALALTFFLAMRTTRSLKTPAPSGARPNLRKEDDESDD